MAYSAKPGLNPRFGVEAPKPLGLKTYLSGHATSPCYGAGLLSLFPFAVLRTVNKQGRTLSAITGIEIYHS